MSFANGYKTEELNIVGNIGKRNTGTMLRFWPNPDYFDSSRFLLFV